MTGKCLCGAIEFQANEIPGMVFNCHCKRCQVSHGAAFATQAFAVRSSLQFKQGQEYLKEYESTGGIRTFCSICGSRLMNYAKADGDYLSIAVACLDDTYEGQPVADCFTNSKVAWHQLSDEITHFEELPNNL